MLKLSKITNADNWYCFLGSEFTRIVLRQTTIDYRVCEYSVQIGGRAFKGINVENVPMLIIVINTINEIKVGNHNILKV